MLKKLSLILILLGVTSCSTSTFMANKYCKDKFPGFINGSKTFDDCVTNKKADLIKNYKIYDNKVNQCWYDATKKNNPVISTTHIYKPSQRIYDKDRNLVGETEEIDRYETVIDFYIKKKRDSIARECVDKLGPHDELYKEYKTYEVLGPFFIDI